MPEFTFKGIAAGAPVNVAVAQGALSDTGSVSNWGGGSLAEIAIQTTHGPELIAPAAIWFEAVGLAGFNVQDGPAPDETYDPSFHGLTFVWRIDGDPLPAFTAPLNIPDAWKAPNIAFGKKVAFAFNDPGTYTVRLTATDSQGTTAVKTVTVAVADPDTALAGSRTIVFSSAGDFSGAPAGAQQVTTPDGIESALAGISQSHRVLFRRDEISNNVRIDIPSSCAAPVWFGAWGSGARPVLFPERGREIYKPDTSCAANQFTFHDLELRGRWNADTETGDPREEPFLWLFHNAGGPTFYTVHRCTLTGFSKVAPSNITGQPTTILFSDTSVGNYRNYGIFVHPVPTPDARLGFIGVMSASHVDALEGGPTTGLGNDHGPFRAAQMQNVYVGCSDFFSRSGWSGDGVGGIAPQPCLRINTNGQASASWIVDRVACEGGSNIIAMQASGSSRPDTPGNYLFDRLLTVGTAQCIKHAGVGWGGVTIRNTIMIQPDIQQDALRLSQFLEFASDNPQTGTLTTPINVHHSSFINLMSAANNSAGDVAIQTGLVDWGMFYELNDVVYHAPTQATPATADSPIDTTTAIAGFAPRYNGKRVSLEKPSGTLAAAVASGASLSVAYPAGTNAADFAGAALTHGFIDNSYVSQDLGDISVAFGGAEILVTNLTGADWPAGADYSFGFHKTSGYPNNTALANPGSVPLPRPLSGSAAIGDSDPDSELDIRYDALLADRPATGETRGALEPD